MSGIVELLRKKRNGEELSHEEIKEFVNLTVSGIAEDCQIGAMLMAMFIRGLTTEETISLTKSMIESGETLDWGEELLIVDKHSTGGVGDKVSIPLVPALAACGLKVPMISGRGLDFSGGTLDKLESIPGFKVNCSIPELKNMMDKVGCFIAGANKQLAPGDRILYKVRDITATVENSSLCIASILSKKIAEGTKYLVIDVKVGEATFFKTYESAKKMAELLINVCKGLNLNARAVLTKMSSPIGCTIGNALEIEESINCLRGIPCPQLNELVETLGGHILKMSNQASSLEQGKSLIRQVIQSGKALDKFQEMLICQGVTPKLAQELCHGSIWSVLPTSQHKTSLHAKSTGFVHYINGIVLAKATHTLGAGRTYADQPLDYSAGVKLKKSFNDPIEKGEVWIEVHHANSKETINEVLYEIENAIIIKDEPSRESSEIILGVVS